MLGNLLSSSSWSECGTADGWSSCECNAMLTSNYAGRREKLRNTEAARLEPFARAERQMSDCRLADGYHLHMFETPATRH